MGYAVRTKWTAGSVVEVGWGIRANHGGGYSYRLCKESDHGVTEECFQNFPLAFVGDLQHVQFGSNASKRVSFVANRTKVGTVPKGSQWTKNPIPACASHGGGSNQLSGTACWLVGTQFPSPGKNLDTGGDLHGFCEAQGTHWRPDCLFTIVDQVQIPENTEPGKYVLSFRWDCEQTPQIWSTCSNIEILPASTKPGVI